MQQEKSTIDITTKIKYIYPVLLIQYLVHGLDRVHMTVVIKGVNIKAFWTNKYDYLFIAFPYIKYNAK